MTENTDTGARALRRAGNAPKRKRAREARRQPTETQAAKPPQSGRHDSDRDLPARAPTFADFNPMRPAKPANMKQALQIQSGAALNRAIGQAMIDEGDTLNGRFQVAQADTMDARVADFMDVGSHVTGPQRIGNGGELVVVTKEAQASIPGVIDTLRQSPGMLSASASRERMELTGNALTLAADAADSIQPRNSLEKMLAHQLAAAHRLAMLFADRSGNMLEQYRSYSGNHVLSVEASRLANAAARMMAAFQDGFIALDRVRRGGRQTVKVVHQHVAVGPGGQAVVAGNLKSGGHQTGGRRRNAK